MLSVDEISKAQFLNLHGMKTISSLEGIQYLTNLQSLDVSTTSVSDLSPVKNSSLKRLDCRSSKVGSVDLTRYRIWKLSFAIIHQLTVLMYLRMKN